MHSALSNLTLYGKQATVYALARNFSLEQKTVASFAALNIYNTDQDECPDASDVVVVGGGIHSLIYAIHTRALDLQQGEKDVPISLTLFEKSRSPSYKIGESTLTVFGIWLKTIGIDAPMLWRLFGPKDGLAFYYFSSAGDPENYTEFTANGPPGDYVPTLQIERKVSELMLTLFAQRLGIRILHGKEVILEQEDSQACQSEGLRIRTRDCETKEEHEIRARLVIDASGRHHRFLSRSKGSRIERVKGFNTDAYWAYWECPGDEADIPLRNYESVNTNHLCVEEGWAWVIRLPSWEGSPLPNLISMINHLLDLNAAKTPADDYLSTAELVTRFGLKFRWVTSIGFALRSDVVYPENILEYGSCEAERKFNWVVSRYDKLGAFMSKHTLIKDLYGPGTTWFVRKNIAFRSLRVTGNNWMAIGDATGFTNPLYSLGINANMGTSIFAAEMTKQYLATSSLVAKNEMFLKYEMYCKDRIPNLQQMNVFNYVCMRSPVLGPIGPLWQYLIGTGNANFQNSKNFNNLENCAQLLTTWDWGSNEEEYVAFSKLISVLIGGPLDRPLEPTMIDFVAELSEQYLRAVLASGKYKGRWGGLLRFYDDDLNFRKYKIARDVLAQRCQSCGEWRMLRPDMRKCAFCKWEHSIEDSTKLLYGS